MNEQREIIYQEIITSSIINNTSVEDEFIRFYANIMMENEEISEYFEMDFSGKKGNQTYKVDGYSNDNVDESLTLFISHFSNKNEEGTLTKTEIESLYKKVRNFVEFSFSGYIGENCEESQIGTQLAEDIKRNKKNIFKIRIYILTDYKLSERVKSIKKEPIDDIPVEINIWDITRVSRIIDSNMEKEIVEIQFKDYNVDGLDCLVTSEGISNQYKSFLVVVPGAVLADLYIDYGEKLLEGNVRSFLSVRGNVNKQIRNTILYHPSLFFAYNNGIAVTARDVELQNINGKTIIVSLKDMQIINGGQTTASLAKAKLQDKADLSNIYVQMKLSIVEPEFSKKLIPDISRYANSQNKVSEADFFANSPFHVRIEEFSRKIPAPPAQDGEQYNTFWFYERARGQYEQRMLKLTQTEIKKFKLINPTHQRLKKTDLAKYQLTFKELPYIVSMGAQKAMKEFAGVVEKRWGEDGKYFNKLYFKKAISHAICFKELEKIVTKQPWYQSGYRANIVTYTLSYIMQSIRTNSKAKTINYKLIWQNQKMYDSLVNETIKISKKMYDHLISENRTIINISEWAKKKECWNQAIKIKHDFSKEFYDDLLDVNIVKDEEKSAEKDQNLGSKIDLNIKIAEFEEQIPGYWKSVLNWGIKTKIIFYDEQDLIQKLVKAFGGGNLPNDVQMKKIYNCRKRFIENGMDDHIVLIV